MSEPSIEFYNAAIDAVQAGQIDEALAAVERSLTEDPKDSQTWQLYVVILNALGRSEEAAKATDKLKEMGLSEVDEQLLKAAEATTAGNLAGAVAHYQAALDAEPDRADIQASYALALMEAGDSENALAAAEKAAALAPDDAPANYALGHILRLTGNKQAALTALSKAVSSDPGFMIARYEQGMVLAATGKLNEALAAFEKFLDIHPGDANATEAVTSIKAALKGGS
ncbi:MAG: tetratricopeptide repeat protein [Akkermansiaceae bacterium]|nr:tetratricopeptide repeat protein [Akkermansiaceae bacterium]